MKTTANQETHTPSHSNQPFFNKKIEGSISSISTGQEQTFFPPNQVLQKSPISEATKTVHTPPFQPTAVVQPKLTINEPGDKYEQEADAMAEQVVRLSAPAGEGEDIVQTQPASQSFLQRKSDPSKEKVPLREMAVEEPLQAYPLMRKAEGDGASSRPLISQLHSTKGTGNALPGETLDSMNQAFGADFSQVRIHIGAQAAEMSQEIRAKAFTHGTDIYFNKGKFDTESNAGKKLLAHELTHTLQQSGADGFIQRNEDISAPGPVPAPTQTVAQAGTSTKRRIFISFAYKVDHDLIRYIDEYFATNKEKIFPAYTVGSPLMKWHVQKVFGLGEIDTISLLANKPWSHHGSKLIERKKVGHREQFSMDAHYILETLEYLQKTPNSGITPEKVDAFRAYLHDLEALSDTDYKYFTKKGKYLRFSDAGFADIALSNMQEFQKSVKEFKENKYEILRDSGQLAEYIKFGDDAQTTQFKELADKFYGRDYKSLTSEEKQEILLAFKDRALFFTYQTLFRAQKISQDELRKYKYDPAKLDELAAIISGEKQFYTSQNEAIAQDILSLLKDIRKIGDRYKITTELPGFFIRMGESQVRQWVSNSSFAAIINEAGKEIKSVIYAVMKVEAERYDLKGDALTPLSSSPLVDAIKRHRTLLRQVYFRIRDEKQPIKNKFNYGLNRNDSTAMTELSKDILLSQYPGILASIKLMEQKNADITQSKGQEHLILYDVSGELDLRKLARWSTEGIKAEVLRILNAKKDGAAETLGNLYRDNTLVWKFQPLLQFILENENLKDQAFGKVVQRKIDDENDSSIWLSVLGIVLGVMGIFTGGATTFLGAALLTGSAVISGIELMDAIVEYDIQKAAHEASFDIRLMQEPSVMGIVFAAIGLGLDLSDVLKGIALIGKSAKGSGKLLSELDEAVIRKNLDETYTILEKEGKEIVKTLSREEFVEKLWQGWKRNAEYKAEWSTRLVSSWSPELNSLIHKYLGGARRFQKLPVHLKESLFKLHDLHPETLVTVLKHIGKNENALTRFAENLYANPEIAKSLVKVQSDFMPDTQRLVTEYLAGQGSNTLSTLPQITAIFQRGHLSAELRAKILTNRNLQQVVLSHPGNADFLLKHWEDYVAKAAGKENPAGFLDFLNTKGVSTALPGASRGETQAVKLTKEQIVTATAKDAAAKTAVSKHIASLVDKSQVSPEVLQAIIRHAEGNLDHLAKNGAEGITQFLYMLNSGLFPATNKGLSKEARQLLLNGLERPDTFGIASTLVLRASSGGGYDLVENILRYTSLDEMALIGIQKADLPFLRIVMEQVPLDKTMWDLHTLLNATAQDIQRLSRIVESMGKGTHTIDKVLERIIKADAFDKDLAAALAKGEGGLEDTAKVIWGEPNVKISGGKIELPDKFRKAGKVEGKEGTGSFAYGTIMKDTKKGDELVARVLDANGEIDPIKWAVVRKSIANSNADQAIINSIIGELWTRVNIRSLEKKGYTLVRREVKISYVEAAGSKAKVAKIDAIMQNGSEVLFLEFKTGDAIFSEGQAVIYPMLQEGRWAEVVVGNKEARALMTTDNLTPRMLEVREPYAGN